MDSTIVRVNVGGTVFTTTQGTIQKAKYFSEISKNPDLSNVMIDRNPDTFSYLLDCLRDHKYISNRLNACQPDIEYFGMDCLIQELKNQLPTITVNPGSSFYVKFTFGRASIYNKKDVHVKAGTPIELKGIKISLPYNGHVELLSGYFGFQCISLGASAVLENIPLFPSHNGAIEADAAICHLVFYKAGVPQAIVL
jgi:hypothetical protein